LTLNRQWQAGLEMSDTGFTVPRHDGTTPPLRRHRHCGHEGSDHPNPAEFVVAVEQAASARAASIVSAHTTRQIISIVAVLAADQPAAVAVALAVVSDALKRPVASSTC
jgi:hypothetical protein